MVCVLVKHILMRFNILLSLRRWWAGYKKKYVSFCNSPLGESYLPAFSGTEIRNISRNFCFVCCCALIRTVSQNQMLSKGSVPSYFPSCCGNSYSLRAILYPKQSLLCEKSVGVTLAQPPGATPTSWISTWTQFRNPKWLNRGQDSHWIVTPNMQIPMTAKNMFLMMKFVHLGLTLAGIQLNDF